MIETISCGTTTIGLCSIAEGEPGTRRQRERDAALAIVRSLTGDAEATIGHDADGAPTLSGWHISVTHSRRLAAVAIDRSRPIGIDAEEWRPTLSRVVAKFLSEKEQEYISTPEELLAAWTIKEAVYKLAAERYLDCCNGIAISPTLASADVGGRTAAITTLRQSPTRLTLAYWL